MVRIYLDWNVISNLKQPKFQYIKKFIEQYKSYLQFPYTPAHFSDFMKSYQPDNEYFYQDLKTLEYLSDNNFMLWEKDCVHPYNHSPKKYFDSIKNNEKISDFFDIDRLLKEIDDSATKIGVSKLGGLVKSLLQRQPVGMDISEKDKDLMKNKFPEIKLNSKNMWDLIKDMSPIMKNFTFDRNYYKNFRKKMTENVEKLDPNSGNWDYDQVIKNIDTFLINANSEMTFLDYVANSFKFVNGQISSYSFYVSAYLLLDFIGYKRDTLPKATDNFLNINTDAEHSFYGANCDYFVVDDKKLRIKSKVLYSQFNVSTKVIESNEFILEVGKNILQMQGKIYYINQRNTTNRMFNDIIKYCNRDRFIKFNIDNKNNIECFTFKLPEFYFNYFNRVTFIKYLKEEKISLSFEKITNNFSHFVFDKVLQSIIDSLTTFFGFDDKEEIKKVKNRFLHEKTLSWSVDGFSVKFFIKKSMQAPILNYSFELKKWPILNKLILTLDSFKLIAELQKVINEIKKAS